MEKRMVKLFLLISFLQIISKLIIVEVEEGTILYLYIHMDIKNNISLNISQIKYYNSLINFRH